MNCSFKICSCIYIPNSAEALNSLEDDVRWRSKPIYQTLETSYSTHTVNFPDSRATRQSTRGAFPNMVIRNASSDSGFHLCTLIHNLGCVKLILLDLAIYGGCLPPQIWTGLLWLMSLVTRGVSNDYHVWDDATPIQHHAFMSHTPRSQ